MKKIFFTLFILVATIGQAQNIKFGKISDKDVKKTAYSADEATDAEILYREKRITYDYLDGDGGFRQITEVHERIKIYNKEALDAANVSVRLYKGGKRDESLIGLKGITYNLENGKVEKTKMRNDAVFKEELNEFWDLKKFALPNVKEGSVIEYTYKIESHYTSTIDDIFLQSFYPIRKMNIEVRVPEYYVFKKYLNPHADFTPAIKESIVNRKIQYSADVNRRAGDAMTEKQRGTIDLKEMVYIIEQENVPAFSNEPYITSPRNYLAQLKWDIAAFKFPNRSQKVFSTNWEKVTKSIYESESFGKQLDKGGFKAEVASLVNGITERDQIIKVIFEHVKNKMKWNNFNSIYSRDLKKAYKEQEGSVADINLLLVAMLREAGVNANPILVSTKTNGIPLFPTREGFNYVICGVEIPNDVILLDATEDYTLPNLIPVRAINWQGRMVRKDGSSVWVMLEPKENSKVSTMLNASIANDLTIKGKVRSSYTGHNGITFRKRNTEKAEEDQISTLEKNKGNVTITNVAMKNQDDIYKNIMRSYDFTLNDAVEEIAGKLYVNPLLFLAEEENIFKQNTRNYPIDFKYPHTEKIIVSISIPEGYKIESLPAPKDHLIRDNIGGFSFQIAEKPNAIQVIMTKSINYSLIPKDYYLDVKSYVSEVIKKETEKAVLSKI